MEWQKHERMRRQEQAQMALDTFERTWGHRLSGDETEDEHDRDYGQLSAIYRHGPEYLESVDWLKV